MSNNDESGLDRDTLEWLGTLLGGAIDIDGPGASRRARMLEGVRARLGNDSRTVETRRAAGAGWTAGPDRMEYMPLPAGRDGRELLVRLSPGAVVDPHSHPADEETVVLEGEIEVGSQRLGPGDSQLAPAGSRHDTIRSRDGALLLIRYRA